MSTKVEVPGKRRGTKTVTLNDGSTVALGNGMLIDDELLAKLEASAEVQALLADGSVKLLREVAATKKAEKPAKA